MLFHEWKLTYNEIKELKFTLHSWHAYLACIPVGIVDAGIVALVQPLWHCVCACTWVCEGERGENGTFSASGFNVQCIDSTQTASNVSIGTFTVNFELANERLADKVYKLHHFH